MRPDTSTENQGSRSQLSQKARRLLLHVRPANLTPSTALLMLPPPPGSRYPGGTCKCSSQLRTASHNAAEALVSSIGKTAAPAHTVTALHRQKLVPYFGSVLKTVFSTRCPTRLWFAFVRIRILCCNKSVCHLAFKMLVAVGCGLLLGLG